MKKVTISLQTGEGDMHEVCEIAAKISGPVPRTGWQTLHSTLFSNTVRTPSVQALFGKFSGKITVLGRKHTRSVWDVA